MSNLAARSAAVFSLSAKNLRGGGADNRPAGRARLSICFTVPHYLSNFPFVGRPRYFSPVPVLAGEKYHTMNFTKNTVGFRRHFCLLYLFFYYKLFRP